jgi:hypothetical protein
MPIVIAIMSVRVVSVMAVAVVAPVCVARIVRIVIPVEKVGRGKADAHVSIAVSESEAKTHVAPDRAGVPVGDVIPIRIPEPVGIGIGVHITGDIDGLRRGRLTIAQVVRRLLLKVVVVLLCESPRGVFESRGLLGVGDFLCPGLLFFVAARDDFVVKRIEMRLDSCWVVPIRGAQDGRHVYVVDQQTREVRMIRDLVKSLPRVLRERGE